MIVRFKRTGKRDTEHESEILGYAAIEFDTEDIKSSLKNGRFQMTVNCLVWTSDENPVPHSSHNHVDEIFDDYNNGFIAIDMAGQSEAVRK